MAKKEISYKQIGQNVILIVEGKQYSRKVADKEERADVKANVEFYNKKNSATLLKDIISFMEENKKTVETKKKLIKAKKVEIKPIVAEIKPEKEVVEKAEEVKKIDSIKIANTAPSTYCGRGEY